MPLTAPEPERLRARLARELSPDALQSYYAEGADLTPDEILDELARSEQA